MSADYIAPETATHIRIHPDGAGFWLIDAADENGGYIEVCWDSRFWTDDKGERRWQRIPSIDAARELVDLFAQENVPHLGGTEPRIIENV